MGFALFKEKSCSIDSIYSRYLDTVDSICDGNSLDKYICNKTHNKNINIKNTHVLKTRKSIQLIHALLRYH